MRLRRRADAAACDSQLGAESQEASAGVSHAARPSSVLSALSFHPRRGGCPGPSRSPGGSGGLGCPCSPPSRRPGLPAAWLKAPPSSSLSPAAGRCGCVWGPLSLPGGRKGVPTRSQESDEQGSRSSATARLARVRGWFFWSFPGASHWDTVTTGVKTRPGANTLNSDLTGWGQEGCPVCLENEAICVRTPPLSLWGCLSLSHQRPAGEGKGRRGGTQHAKPFPVSLRKWQRCLISQLRALESEEERAHSTGGLSPSVRVRRPPGGASACAAGRASQWPRQVSRSTRGIAVWIKRCRCCI